MCTWPGLWWAGEGWGPRSWSTWPRSGPSARTTPWRWAARPCPYPSPGSAASLPSARWESLIRRQVVTTEIRNIILTVALIFKHSFARQKLELSCSFSDLRLNKSWHWNKKHHLAPALIFKHSFARNACLLDKSSSSAAALGILDSTSCDTETRDTIPECVHLFKSCLRMPVC